MDQGAKTLVDMAETDSRIFELKNRLKAFPHRLAEARRQLSAEEVLLREVDEPWSELENKVMEKEATIHVALETIVKFEEHIQKVTTQKEYMAAKKQVEEARKLNEQLQDEILENRVKQEELSPKLTELRERYGRVKSDFEQMEKEILGEQGKLEKEVASEQADLRTLFEGLDEQVWTYYGKLISSGKAPGIVPVAGGTCGGCNMAIPPQSYNLAIAEPGKIHTCAHCARIIYYKAPEPVLGEEGEVLEQAQCGS